jgi:tRNA(Ile)-lysidine synthetase-like protein
MPIMERLRYFRNTITRLQVFRPNDRVVIGVSGGADSLALMHLFAQSRSDLGIEPYVVHVNHGIRGDESDADAAFVSTSADHMGIQYRIMYADVPALAGKHKLTLEEAARKARYSLLAQAADEIGARVIAVAHNADDQAETVLMHLLRGSGLAGLRGMLPVTPLSESHLLAGTSADHTPFLQIIRPLLDATRAEIEAYCAASGLHPRIDSTNADTTYTRNRIRHEVMPILKQISPSVIESIGRTAKIAAADYDLIQREAEETIPQIARKSTRHYIAFDLGNWNSLPFSIKREMIRQTVEMGAGSTENLTFDQIDRVIELASSRQIDAKVELAGGVVAHITRDALYLSDTLDLDSVLPKPNAPMIQAPIVLTEMGQYPLPESKWRITLSEYEGARSGKAWNKLIKEQWVQPFDADSLSFPLTLQPRRPDLKFYPQGAGGSQSLKEFMNKAHIPRALRDQLPILTHGDNVIWVCGYRLDERYIVKSDTQRIWLAHFEKSR